MTDIFCLLCKRKTDIKENCFCRNLLHFVDVPSGKDWTLKKRNEWFGKINNKNAIECENFQRSIIEATTQMKCMKSNHLRINKKTLRLEAKRNVFKEENAFDFTEDFDGLQIFNNIFTVYYNFKFTVGIGGSQNRTVRDVYSFIDSQFQIQCENIYFANILDGNIYFKYKKNFDYLFKKYANFKNIYIGDSKNFYFWLLNFAFY